MRLCFEPFKINTSNLIEGLDSGECILGGKQIVDGVKMYFCKLNELEGFDDKKTAKPCGIRIKVPEWVLETEGDCRFSTKKPSDLERHLLGVHSLKFRDYAYHCTHCDSVFVDRGRANTHMNGCSNLRRWGTECRDKFPIHHEFLDRFLYWTSDKVVLSKRPKQKTILSAKT